MALTLAADWAIHWQKPTPADIAALVAQRNIEGVIIQPELDDSGALSAPTITSIEECKKHGLSIDLYFPPCWQSYALDWWTALLNRVTEKYPSDIARWWLDVEKDGLSDTTSRLAPREILAAMLEMIHFREPLVNLQSTGMYGSPQTFDQYGIVLYKDILPVVPIWLADWTGEPHLPPGAAMCQYAAGVKITETFTVDLNAY